LKKIAIISDTHGFFDEAVLRHLEDRDEVWHAGDIGNIKLADFITNRFNTKMVYGNIDGKELRATFPEYMYFTIEQFPVLMIHIAGKFASYTPELRRLIDKYAPKMLVCGHSHILKIAFDQKYQFLYLNPGACGISGFHKVRTIVKFIIDNDQIKQMEIIELAQRHGSENLISD
jgi:uncharacterized protein